MRYMLLIHDEEAAFDNLSEADIGQVMAEYGAFGQAVEEAGICQSCDRLHPTAMATTVRVQEGKTLTTDGPFAETKEQLGGYYLIDVKNLDEAIQWASRVPSAKFGCVEVRPIWEPEESVADDASA